MTFFDSIFNSTNLTSPQMTLICLGVALICGIIFATICFIRSDSTKSFAMTTALLPMVVALVITLVNGNIGAGVAIAGAFSLVRFRSVPGTAKEICVIFISMASGLAFGMGYVAYGAIFIILSGVIIVLMESLKVWEKKPVFAEKSVRITIPEDLDYTCIFDDIFEKYTTKYQIVKVKTTNLGSMFRIYYEVTLKDVKREKEMIDEIRERNGNLEVLVQRIDYKKAEL